MNPNHKNKLPRSKMIHALHKRDNMKKKKKDVTIDSLLARTSTPLLPRKIEFLLAKKESNARLLNVDDMNESLKENGHSKVMPKSANANGNGVSHSQGKAGQDKMQSLLKFKIVSHPNGNSAHSAELNGKTPSTSPDSSNSKSNGTATKPNSANGIHSTSASAHSASPKIKPIVALAQKKISDDNSFKYPMYQLFNPELLPAPKWKTTAPGKGLYNLGNTCFLNAVLQAVTHTPFFANYLASHDHAKNCPYSAQSSNYSGHRLQGYCFFCALEKHVTASLSSPKNGPISPDIIVNNLRYISKSFRRGCQEDAHEFLRLAMDKLQENALAAYFPPPPPVPASPFSNPFLKRSSFPPQSKPKEAPLPKFLSHLSPLSPYDLHRIKHTTSLYQIYAGYLHSEVICPKCEHRSNTFDPFLDLSLEIAHSNLVTLDNALTSFTRSEALDTANLYRCADCKQKVKAHKRITIYRAPNVLVVHLKRFEFSRSHGGKIGKHVQYQTSLDLAPYMSSLSDKYDVTYSLFAVLVHSGSSVHSGHYYCYVKAGNGKWYLMDDSHVREVNENEVLNQRAYILFYDRNRVQYNSLPTASQEIKVTLPQPVVVANGHSSSKAQPISTSTKKFICSESPNNQYGSSIDSWEDADSSVVAAQRKTIRKLVQTDAETREHKKDEWDEILDSGHARKVKGPRDELRGSAVSNSGGNLFQLTLESHKDDRNGSGKKRRYSVSFGPKRPISMFSNPSKRRKDQPPSASYRNIAQFSR